MFGITELIEEFRRLQSVHKDLTEAPLDDDPDGEWAELEERLETERTYVKSAPRDVALGAYSRLEDVVGSDPGEPRRYRYLDVVLRWLDKTVSLDGIQYEEGEDTIRPYGSLWWRVNQMGGEDHLPGAYGEEVDGDEADDDDASSSQGHSRWGSGMAGEAFPHLERGKIPASDWVGDDDVFDAFEAAYARTELRVGLCSLNGDARTTFVGSRPLDTEGGIHGFQAASVQGDRVDDELKEVVRWAWANGVHMLMMPELTVDPDGRDVMEAEVLALSERLREKQRKQSEVAPRGDEGELALVIPGSFHEDRYKPPGDEGNRLERPQENVAPVWFVNGGNVKAIVDVVKRDTFEMWTKDPATVSSSVRDAHAKAWGGTPPTYPLLREDLGHGSRLPFIRTSVGVLAALICKDVLVGPYENELGGLPYRAFRSADQVAIVSMNRSARAWFEGQAALAVYQYLAGVFYTNAVQLVERAEGETEASVMFWAFPEPAGVVVCDPTLKVAPPDPEPPPGEEPGPPAAHDVVLHRRPKRGTERTYATWPPDGLQMIRIPFSPLVVALPR